MRLPIIRSMLTVRDGDIVILRDDSTPYTVSLSIETDRGTEFRLVGPEVKNALVHTLVSFQFSLHALRKNAARVNGRPVWF
jgi:hypothetical protein